MTLDPDTLRPAAGPHDPLPTTPRRLAGSVRRTSSIDTSWPEDRPGVARVQGRARELRVGSDGSTRTEELEVLLVLDELDGRRIVDVVVSGDPALTKGADRLVGAEAARGLRRALTERLPEHVATRSLLNLVLDDLPGALLVSGYRALREGRFTRREGPERHLATQHLVRQEDLCAGWATDGGMMTAARTTGSVPVPYGPPCPPLERADDPLSWHRLDPLSAGSMRRVRRIDVLPADGDGHHRFEAHFRDVFGVSDTQGMVLHEYLVTGAVDPSTGVLVRTEAEARVLPWTECPGSLGSAARTVGVAVGELPALIRGDFHGTTTCTHLNDTLRFLADLAPMLG